VGSVHRVRGRCLKTKRCSVAGRGNAGHAFKTGARVPTRVRFPSASAWRNRGRRWSSDRIPARPDNYRTPQPLLTRPLLHGSTRPRTRRPAEHEGGDQGASQVQGRECRVARTVSSRAKTRSTTPLLPRTVGRATRHRSAACQGRSRSPSRRPRRLDGCPRTPRSTPSAVASWDRSIPSR
jgi:hypothetical protein